MVDVECGCVVSLLSCAGWVVCPGGGGGLESAGVVRAVLMNTPLYVGRICFIVLRQRGWDGIWLVGIDQEARLQSRRELRKSLARSCLEFKAL